MPSIQPTVVAAKPLSVMQLSVSPKIIALDLAGVLSRAKDNSPVLRAAKAQIAERKGAIREVRADALPHLALYGKHNKNESTGLSQKSPILLSNYEAGLNISQPLFHWGKLGSAIHAAKVSEQEADFHYITAELDVLHSVAKEYIAALIAKAELEITNIRLKTAEQFLANIKAKMKMQTAIKLDLLRAESEYLDVFPENLQAEAAYKKSMELLSSHLALDPTITLQLSRLELSDITMLPSSLCERSEISQYKQQETIYRINEKVISSALRPHFDFNASYGSTARDSADLFKRPKHSERSFDSWHVGVSMRFELFDGMKASGQLAQNRAKLEQVIQNRINKERAIYREKHNAERELQKAVALHKAVCKAHDASVEELNINRESFEQGLVTSADLLRAEHAERKQESKKIRAELGIWTALFDYRRSHGLPPV